MTEMAKQATDYETDSLLLEALVVDNPDLAVLEALLDQFNVFEAIGVVRQELRHSDCLAFLLDPRQTHGIGDAFVRRFLQKALIAAQPSAVPISRIDLDLWTLDQATVVREWHNIDILWTDNEHQLVVLIENKIGSAEHSDQLGRYLRTIQDHYAGWKVLPLYLSPEGEAPSDHFYVPVSYGVVCEAVQAVAEDRSSALDPDVYVLMTHYARMLRRHVVSDSETAELCRRIYQRHKRALDLIYEHRPSMLAEIRGILVALIQSEPGLILDSSPLRAIIRFGHAAWETDALKAGEGWTPSGRMLLFEVDNAPERLGIRLWVGPGPAETRSRLVEAARKQSSPFRVSREGAKWIPIYTRSFLRQQDYDEATVDQIEVTIRDRWERFVKDDLPKLVLGIGPTTLEGNDGLETMLPGQ